MTSRLKRKLNDLGVDPSSSKANESFCLIGTPLPPLEKSRDTGEFVPLWKQDVRDEQGRRRLHGAFTGGFSAGYFNTVGSKEGWTPQTFVSSRSDRAKKKAVRPEDFMDEEDLAELAESRKLVDETDEMDVDLLGGTKAEMSRKGGEEEDSMAATLAASLLPTPKDSVGAKILKKMGWRPGQGVGPRVTLRQLRLQDLQFSTGGTATADDLPDEEDEEAKKHTYAPRDTPLLVTTRKDNSHGIGYSTGMGLHEAVGHAKGSAGSRLAAGFGLGALNDADEDDLDVYDTSLGASSSRHTGTRMAYDAMDRDDDDGIAIGGRASRQPTSRKPPAGSSQTFRDGNPVLPGFVLSSAPVAEDKWFPLPDVPPGWTPNPKRVWESKWDKENMGEVKPLGGARSHAEWKKGVSADERGALLGETPLPAAPKSVFDFISQKDRDRLKNIASQPSQPQASHAPPPAPLPHLEPSVAQLALRGFQPYVAIDAAKHKRYTAFLHACAIGQPLPMGELSTEDARKELDEFVKAAMVFRPLGGAMAGRFTTGTVQDLGAKMSVGLQFVKSEEVEVKEETEVKEVESTEEEDPKKYAARMGMYGPMTREVKPWVPAKLLCKRFGVKPPENAEQEKGAEGAPAAGTSGAAGMGGWKPEDALADAGRTTAEVAAVMEAAPARGAGGKRDLANVGLGEVDEAAGKEILEYERPAMDVFKAIFASDDESGDEDEQEEPEEAVKAEEPEEVARATAAVAVPSHLAIEPTAKATYGGATTAQNQVEEKVDLATFKPMFVPRSERETKKDKEREKKKEEKKDKGKGKALVSFGDDEEGDVGLGAPRKEKKKRDKEKEKEGGREKKRRKEGEADDEMWVEKPVAEAVKSFVHPAPPDTAPVEKAPIGPPRSRKRAADFM